MTGKSTHTRDSRQIRTDLYYKPKIEMKCQKEIIQDVNL